MQSIRPHPIFLAGLTNMEKDSGDNAVKAPEQSQVGDSGIQSQLQQSQTDGSMANLGSQRNLDSAQASQELANQGLVGNLQLTGDVNGNKGAQSSDSNDNAANSIHATQDSRNPWAPNNGGATTDTNVQSVGSTEKNYNDRNPESAKNDLKSFGSVTSDTNAQIHGSTEKSSNDFNPESKSKDGSKFENPGQSENKGQ